MAEQGDDTDRRPDVVLSSLLLLGCLYNSLPF